jgi:hypothetical protein
MTGVILGILVVALVSTLGDFVWYHFGVRHRALAGILHGAVLLMSVGGVLGVAANRFLRGLPLGVLAGVGGALAYYALLPLIGRSAMLASWVAVWLILAFLAGRVLSRAPIAEILVRGLIAAVLGGIAFYLVVDLLWGRPAGADRNYLVQFAAWTFAWAPGILALTVGRSSPSSS